MYSNATNYLFFVVHGGVSYIQYIDTIYKTRVQSKSGRKIIPYQFGTVVHSLLLYKKRVGDASTSVRVEFFCNSSNFSQYNGFNETIPDTALACECMLGKQGKNAVIQINEKSV